MGVSIIAALGVFCAGCDQDEVNTDAGPVDASIDATTPDAMVDAGIDAAAPDAGPEDAGPQDSGRDADVGLPTPGEVRALRLVPGEDSVTVLFRSAPDAVDYLACVATAGDPRDGHCEVTSTSPHELLGLDPGVEVGVVVIARNAEGVEGPVVERPRVTPGPPTRPLGIEFRMAPADLDELYTRPIDSDDLLPSEVWLTGAGGEVEVPNVRGLRFRGSGSRSLSRKSFNVRLDSRPQLPEYPNFNFRSATRRAGNRILVNQTWTDPTGIRPALAFGMYTELGHPAPETFLADLWMNGVYEGQYVCVERVDTEALRGWGFPDDDGTFTLVRDGARDNRHLPEIHSMSIFNHDPETFGANDNERREFLSQVFGFRGEREDQSWDAILELVRFVHDVESGPDFAAGLAEHFDVDHLVDVLALFLMQDDFDSLGDDYWLHRNESGDQLFRIIPWDMDLTFGRRWYPPNFWAGHDFFYYNGSVTGYTPNPLFEKAYESLADVIRTRVEELYATVFTEEYFESRIADLVSEVADSLLRWPEPAFDRHPRQHRHSGRFLRWHVEALSEFQRLRRVHLLAPRDLANTNRFSGAVTFDEQGRAYLADGEGLVLIRLDGEPGANVTLTVELEADPGLDGVQRVWRVRNDGAPWSGPVTFYYQNRPGNSWLPGEPVAAGRNWELTVVADGDWLPTRVNPFANAVTAEITLAGEVRFELLYRR